MIHERTMAFILTAKYFTAMFLKTADVLQYEILTYKLQKEKEVEQGTF